MEGSLASSRATSERRILRQRALVAPGTVSSPSWSCHTAHQVVTEALLPCSRVEALHSSEVPFNHKAVQRLRTLFVRWERLAYCDKCTWAHARE